MIDVSQDIHSLTDFKRNTPTFVEQLREKGGALVLTVNGKAEVVAMSAATFQKVLNALDMLDSIKGIRAGLESMKRGEGRPAEEVLADLAKKHDLPREG